MNILKRVKGILLKPKAEWEIISHEDYAPIYIVKTYLLPLAFIPIIASIINYLLADSSSVEFSNLLIKTLISLIAFFLAVYIIAFIINLYVPFGDGEKNFKKAFALSAYIYTPQLVLGVLWIFNLSLLVILGSLIYGAILLIYGIKPMMKFKGVSFGYNIFTFMLVQFLTFIVLIIYIVPAVLLF